MRGKTSKGGWGVRSSTALVVGVLFLALASSTAWASPDCTSDKRAKPTHGGDPKNCWAIGFRGDTLVGSDSNDSASDENVAGTVGPDTGPVQPGTGQEVDIALEGGPVVVDAVVVGGNGWYNSYKGYQFLPPTGPGHQHYIPPFDDNHRVPNVSYWFTCYHIDPPPAAPEVPQVLEVPLAGGAIFAAWVIVHRRRRKAPPRDMIGGHSASS